MQGALTVAIVCFILSRLRAVVAEVVAEVVVYLMACLVAQAAVLLVAQLRLAVRERLHRAIEAVNLRMARRRVRKPVGAAAQVRLAAILWFNITILLLRVALECRHPSQARL